MSEQTATPVAATPVAASPTPAPAAPKQIDAQERHPALRGLMTALQQQAAPGETPKPKAEPEKPAAPVVAAKPVEAAPAEKPIKVKKAKGPERPPLPTAQAAPAAPVAAQPAPVQPTPKIEEQLSEDELAMLEDAREMEKRFSQKHQGLGQRTEKFMIENKAKLDQLKKEGLDPETDQEYQTWLKSVRPSVSARDYEELRVERATSRAREGMMKEHEQLKHDIHVRDEEPKIQHEVTQIYSELARTALPDDVQSELVRLQKEHGPKVGYEMLHKTHKLELDISERVMDAATKDIELFIKLTRETPLKRPILAFDSNNPDHLRIANLIGDTCSAFKENAPKENQIRDGKWFVTRDEWNSMPQEQRGQFWTFDNKELLKVAQRGIKPVIMQSIAAKKKELEAAGYSRAFQPAPAAPATPPTPTPRTNLRPSPIPNAPSAAPTIDARASSINSRLTAGRAG